MATDVYFDGTAAEWISSFYDDYLVRNFQESDLSKIGLCYDDFLYLKKVDSAEYTGLLVELVEFVRKNNGFESFAYSTLSYAGVVCGIIFGYTLGLKEVIP